MRWLPWILCACFVLPSCVAPLVPEAGTSVLRLDGFPKGTVAAEAVTADGVTLRGVFVPAGTGAPVVLHFLPAETSITTGLRGLAGMRETLTVLREHGFASLAMDYRGVGASSGDRCASRLLDDGTAMWEEALRRAGGHPGAVLVRAVSLGSIPAAAIVEGGAAPGALVLVAPVRAETIAGNAARDRYGAFLGSVVAVFLRRPVDVSLDEVLRRSTIPILLLAVEDDVYLPDDERDELLAAAKTGGHTSLVREGDHLQVALRAYCFELGTFEGGLVEELLEVERAFLEDCLSRR